MRKEELKELLEIYKKQEICLEEDDLEMLSELIEKGGVIIEELKNQSNIKMDEEEKKLLECIIEIDERSKKEFLCQYEEVKEKVRRIRVSKHIHSIYNNPYETWQEEGVFFDKK